MSVATMVKRPPPTPPSADGHNIQDGFGLPMQHSVRSEHQPNPYAFDNSAYIPSGPNSFDNTPEPEIGQWYVDQYGNRSFGLYQEQNHLGMNMNFDPYGPKAFPPQHQGIYHPYALQQQHQYPSPMIHGRAPPTPEISDQSTPQVRSTRQNRAGAGTRRPSNSPKPRRAVRKRNANKARTLAGPLSELTKDMTDVQIKDTEAWVNRSVDERREEAKKDNFVKRPSNSFILYRSAYADRARAWEKSPNHQKISSLAGESWSLEPPEIRKQFDAWAKIERDNHAKAFPEYKFQPQITKAMNRKRKGKEGDSEEELSDNASDYEYVPNGAAGVGRSLSKKSKRSHRETSYTPSGISVDGYDPNGFDSADSIHHHPSSYQRHNPGQPLPIALDHQPLPNQYYHMTSHANAGMAHVGHVEDVFVHTLDHPSSSAGGYDHQAPPTLPVIGIPEAYHRELQAEEGGQQMLNPTSQLDPMLASYDQNHLRNGSEQQQLMMSGMGGLPVGDFAPPPPPLPQPVFSPVLDDFESEHGDVETGLGSEELFAAR